MIQIMEGTPFTVPPGGIFVLTALGAGPAGSHSTSVLVDGIEEIRSIPNRGELTVKPVATGFTVQAGVTITLTNGLGEGRAWGYVVDA